MGRIILPLSVSGAYSIIPVKIWRVPYTVWYSYTWLAKRDSESTSTENAEIAQPYGLITVHRQSPFHAHHTTTRVTSPEMNLKVFGEIFAFYALLHARHMRLERFHPRGAFGQASDEEQWQATRNRQIGSD